MNVTEKCQPSTFGLKINSTTNNAICVACAFAGMLSTLS